MDYLVIGYITLDKISSGYQIGGTAAYAALTAQSLGMNPAILTSADRRRLDLSKFNTIPVFLEQSDKTTIFENRETGQQREQVIHELAENISLAALPPDWAAPDIVHFGPIAGEFDPQWLASFPNAYKGITPQGLMRSWDEQGKVSRKPVKLPEEWISKFDAIVFSVEDVQEDEDIIEYYAHHASVLAVTEGRMGARIYWKGDMRHFSAPQVEEISNTGAGDIFATTFFYRHKQTRDPWEAARIATQLASNSVTRIGMASIPTPDEVRNQLIEIL